MWKKSNQQMTDCWTIIAEQNGCKSVADNGFLTYEEADYLSYRRILVTGEVRRQRVELAI